MQHIDSQNETMQNDKNLKNIKNGLSNLAIKLSFFQNLIILLDVVHFCRK